MLPRFQVLNIKIQSSCFVLVSIRCGVDTTQCGARISTYSKERKLRISFTYSLASNFFFLTEKDHCISLITVSSIQVDM